MSSTAVSTTAPLYQADRHAVIIQLGRSFTKYDYATGKIVRTTLDQEEWEAILEPLLHRIYYHYLHVVASSRRVVLVEHEFVPTAFRYALATLLFKRLRVPSISYVSEMATPLYLCGLATGLVIDVGFQETRVLPVCFGVLLREAYQVVPVGSATVNQELRKCLIEHARTFDPTHESKVAAISEQAIEEIKTAACYVRFSLQQESLDAPVRVIETKKSLQLEIDATLKLDIPATTRWQAAEVLFSNPGEHDRLAKACVKAFQACNPEVRLFVVENIVTCGGGAQLKGFSYRLATELRAIMEEELPNLVPRLRINRPLCPEILRQWTGAAAYSGAGCDSLQITADEISLSEWSDGKSLPDWVTPSALRVVEAPSTAKILREAAQPTNLYFVLAPEDGVVLKSGGHEDKGEVARLQYFVGAIAVGDLVKSTLGPKGTDKILQPIGGEGSRTDKTTITNDGATILKSVWLDNPAAKILVDVSKQQDTQCGDGTTGVVVLAAELLRNAERLVEQKIHPQVICAGFRLAVQAARTALEKMAFSNEGEKLKEDLLKVARTTLSSKLLTHDRDHFASLAVDAVLRLRGKPNLDYIKKPGGTMRDSFLESGFILDKPLGTRWHATFHMTLGTGQPKRLTNCNVLVANTPMDTDKIKIYGARVKVDSFQAVQELEEAEKEKMKEKVEKIAAHGCNVFINRQLIYNYPDQLFKDHKIMAIEHADFDGTERLAAVLGASIASTFDDPSRTKLGYCDVIEEILIGDDKAIRFSGCQQNEACTIVLRGANLHILEEAERSLHDALAVLSQLVDDTRVVYGAGAAEMWMAEAVDNLARTSLAIDAFASALRQIPAIISSNGGYDAAELVSQLRAEHHDGNMKAGIDISNGSVGDASVLGVYEAYKSKLSQLCAAAEAAEMIVRVDDIIRCAPRRREGM